MINNSSKIKVTGVNINRVYKLLLKNNIPISKINRKDYKTLSFCVNNKNLKKVFAILDNPCYNVKVEKFYGFYAVKNFFIKKVGFVVAVLLFLFAITLNNFYLTSIKVYGNQQVQTNQIIKSMKKAGASIGKTLTRIDLKKCEDVVLEDNEKISLVSVIKKGNCLIVNVKEKLVTESIIDGNNYSCYIASFSGQITQMQVLEGTPLVKIGDNVKQGDIIVAGYKIDDNGQKVKCNAKAKVKAKVWFCSTQTFLTSQTIFKRTGKKIKTSTFYFSNTKMFSDNTKNKFKNFEQSKEEKYLFKNNILPIKRVLTTYYETKPIVVTKKFEDYKQKILEDCYKNARSKVPSNVTITKSFDTINEIQDG